MSGSLVVVVDSLRHRHVAMTVEGCGGMRRNHQHFCSHLQLLDAKQRQDLYKEGGRM